MAAMAARRSETFIGAKHRARLARIVAIKATAEAIYLMVTEGQKYVEQGSTTRSGGSSLISTPSPKTRAPTEPRLVRRLKMPLLISRCIAASFDLAAVIMEPGPWRGASDGALAPSVPLPVEGSHTDQGRDPGLARIGDEGAGGDVADDNRNTPSRSAAKLSERARSLHWRVACMRRSWMAVRLRAKSG